MNQMVRSITLNLLRAYKWAVSPLFLPACRYVPTCSEYAMEAAMKRLLRCHPFVKGGFDPVVKLDDYGTARGAVLPVSHVVAE
jgi:putative membrane protein insertion efficiency factor